MGSHEDIPHGSSGMVPLRAGDPARTPSLPITTAPPRVAARPDWDDKHARRRASATTFGLTGRLVITGGLAAGLAVVAVGNLFGVPFYLAFMAWALRDTWAKGRRPAPLPPHRPGVASRTATGSVADPTGPWPQPDGSAPGAAGHG